MEIYNYKEAKEKFKNDYTIKILLERKKLYKLEKGLYSTNKDVNELTIIFKKYKGAILTMESAFYYYELSTYKPEKITIGTRRNFTRIKSSKVKQIFYTNTYLDNNAIHYEKDNIEVNIFSRERLLVELFRNKKYLSSEYFEEVYQNYLRISDSLDKEILLKYAKMYHIKECVDFANKYIHYISEDSNDNDYYSFFHKKDKNEAFNYGLHLNNFTETCVCCHNKTIGLLQEVCYLCGWRDVSYMKVIDEKDVYEENELCLKEYRERFQKLKSENLNYTWLEKRNRMGPSKKVIKKTILDEEKHTCACCKKDTLNKWYDKCYICGWVADYAQEADQDEEIGANEYSLWMYSETYKDYLKINPEYIYKDNPNLLDDYIYDYFEEDYSDIELYNKTIAKINK